MRINKFIAAAGICSRRAADELIINGLVTVNGEYVTEPGIDIGENDFVCVNGEEVSICGKKYYIVLNKPDGYVTTTHDQFERPSVTDLICDLEARLFPVGRLDYHTEGLLIMTNDGDFANRVMHPRHMVWKTYIAHVNGFPKPQELTKLKRGIVLKDGKTAPAKVEIVHMYPDGTDVSVSIHEGKNRQVRRMLEAIGYKVTALKRVAVGNVRLGHLPSGKWRHMLPQEIQEFVKER